MIDLWDVVQHEQISALRQKVEVLKELSADAKSGKEIALHFERRLDQLTLVCHAMWVLIQERTDLKEGDLLKKVAELDLSDGVKDSKFTRTPIPCPKCDSMISLKFNRCLSCGHQHVEGTAFNAI